MSLTKWRSLPKDEQGRLIAEQDKGLSRPRRRWLAFRAARGHKQAVRLTRNKGVTQRFVF